MQKANLQYDILPAARLSGVSEYYFSVKLKEIAAMNAGGANVINLGIGSPDLPPSEDTVRTLSEMAVHPEIHGYQPYAGIPELRAAFARWYSRWYGVSLDPDKEILPLMGSKEGVMHITLAFVNEGDGVLVPDPGYPTYSSVSRLAGARIYKYPLSEDNGWYPDFDGLEAADARGEIRLSEIKLMWCNYPNMPTGAKATREVFERLVAFGKKHGIIICHDNPYSFILNDNPMSILEVEGAKDICIELNSLSKAFNMPGWRIGMLASNPQFVEWVLKVKSNMDSGMFRPIQLAAVKAMDAPKSWYDNMNMVYSHRRELAAKIMDRIGTDVNPDQAGLFLWGKLRDRDTDSKAVCDRILHGARVFVTPGIIFGDSGASYMRISLCCKEDKLEEALRRIENMENGQ